MSNVAPFVSVVMPTYNHARYLGRALQSILNQTYVNWEVIVIDNHSTDNTDDIVSRFDDQRITYLKIHNNGVIAASRNAGIKAAKGEWIAFIDSDDWWEIDKLACCCACINDNVDFIYHDLKNVSNKPILFKRKSMRSRQVKRPVLLDLLLNGNLIATSSVMVRKRIMNKINGMCESTTMVAAEDYNTWLRISKLTNNFLYLPRILGGYLSHDLSSSNRDMSIPTRSATETFLDSLSLIQKNRMESNFRYMSGCFKFKTGNFKGAKLDLHAAFRYSELPTKMKIIIILVMMYLY